MMKLSTCSVFLAVVAVAFAAPQNYGNKGHEKKILDKKIIATTLPADIPKDLEFDCAGKENGGYVEGCMQDYFLCWEGVMTKSSCPENMVFNMEIGGCDFNINVYECTGVHATTLAPEPTTTLKPVDFDCSKLTDGDYAFGTECLLTYVSCVGGKGVERTCPDNLSFDPEKRMCDRLENIEACGGAPTTVAPEVEIKFDCPSPSGSFGLTAQLCSAVYYICNDNIASIAICEDPMIWDDKNKVCALPKDIPECSFDCAGKADAAYSEGCSNTYWWCWQERATKLSCPEGMMFDSERGMCDIHDNIFECTGVHTTTVIAEPIPTLAPVDFDCKGLEDGNHAYKNGEMCQDKFVSCVGGFAWEMTCPEGLLFDPVDLVCEHVENIVACGGTAEPLPTTTLSYGAEKLTSLADEPITKAYGYKKLTTVADEPTTKAYGYKKLTTVADVPTTKAYHVRKTTTLADIPTTKSYGYKKTTILADIPTTKAYHVRKTTTLADEPLTTPLAYNYDNYGEEKILLNEPVTTTRRHRMLPKTTTHMPIMTTTFADEPLTDSYGSYETTTLEDLPTTRAYNVRKTTVRDIPTTKSYGYKKTTTLADIPTTKAYGGYSKLTTVRDIPTTKSYGYKKLTTLADIPTTKAYGGYSKLTTVRDIPTTKSYGYKKLTTLADIPTTRAYGYKKLTTLADIPTTKAYQVRKLTTTLADIPTTEAYSGYEEETTTLADIPTTEAYSGYEEETTTLADIPTTRSYGYKKTTTFADLPTTRSYGVRKTTLADLPTTTMRRRFVKPVEDLPKQY